MRKLFITFAFTAASAAAVAFAGCSGCGTGPEAKKGEAYGLVHGGKYVGCAVLTLRDGRVSDANLTEVCFPTQVKAGDGVAAEDKVCDGDNCYYKTVSYGGVTLTYVEGSGYMNGETSFAEMLKTEANAKQYYDAVMSNAVSVTVGGENKSDILNRAALSKDENGYWTRTDKDGNEYSRWKMNRDATVEYVISNGVENLYKLVKSETPSPDKKEDKEVNFWMDGTVNTGATWVDFNNENAEGYFTYAKLIKTAYDAAK